MRHCTVCGSEMPDTARFCRTCGSRLSQVSTMEEGIKENKGTVRNDTSSEDGRLTEDVTALQTQELGPSEELVHAKQPEDISEVTTKELEPSGELERESGRAAEDVSVLNTQGLAHAREKDREKAGVAGVAIASEVPTESQKVDETHRRQAEENALKVQRGPVARWIILAAICILLLAASAGAFLFLQRSPLPGTSGTLATATNSTLHTPTGVTAVSTVCPTSSTSSSCVKATDLTPIVGTKAIFNISFTGAVKGNMTVTSMTRCGPSNAGTEYDLYFIGTVGGIQYTYVSRIPAYKGPDTYGTGRVSVVFAQQPLSTTAVWGNSGNVPAKVIINGDVKSGSMEVDLTGATNSVHISGNWSCG